MISFRYGALVKTFDLVDGKVHMPTVEETFDLSKVGGGCHTQVPPGFATCCWYLVVGTLLLLPSCWYH